MAQGLREVRISQITQILTALKPHLEEQFNTLNASTRGKYNEYKDILEAFSTSKDSYNTIHRQTLEVFGPRLSYPPGSLGQKLVGCFVYSSVASSLKGCLPGCYDAIHEHSQGCPYNVYEEPSGGGVISLRAGADHFDRSTAAVILRTRSELTNSDVDVLRKDGITKVKLLRVEPGGEISAKPDLIDISSSTTPTAVVVANPATQVMTLDGRPKTLVVQDSQEGWSGWTLLFFAALIVIGLWLWARRERPGVNITVPGGSGSVLD